MYNVKLRDHKEDIFKKEEIVKKKTFYQKKEQKRDRG